MYGSNGSVCICLLHTCHTVPMPHTQGLCAIASETDVFTHISIGTAQLCYASLGINYSELLLVNLLVCFLIGGLNDPEKEVPSFPKFIC